MEGSETVPRRETVEEVIAAAQRLMPEVEHMRRGNLGYITILKAVGLHCFIQELTGEDVEIIRRALIHAGV